MINKNNKLQKNPIDFKGKDRSQEKILPTIGNLLKTKLKLKHLLYKKLNQKYYNK